MTALFRVITSQNWARVPTPRPTRMSIWTTKDRNKQSDQFLQCLAKRKISKLSNHTEAVRPANWVDCRTGIINGKRTDMPICNSKHALCVLSERAITYVSETWWCNCLKVYLKMWKSIEKPLAKINAGRWTNRSTSGLMFYRHKHQQAMWQLAWKSDSDDGVAKLRRTDKFTQTTEQKNSEQLEVAWTKKERHTLTLCSGCSAHSSMAFQHQHQSVLSSQTTASLASLAVRSTLLAPPHKSSFQSPSHCAALTVTRFTQ